MSSLISGKEREADGGSLAVGLAGQDRVAQRGQLLPEGGLRWHHHRGET